MLITFKTDTYANITMFGDIGKTMLRLMEHNQSIPGAILADDVASALSALQRNLSQSNNQQQNTETEDDEDPNVSLDKRALPLIELLQAAIQSHDDIRWEEGC